MPQEKHTRKRALTVGRSYNFLYWMNLMVTLTITYLITQPVGISTTNALDTLWLVFMQLPVFDLP